MPMQILLLINFVSFFNFSEQETKKSKTIHLRAYKDALTYGGHNQFSTIFPPTIMERGGLENMSDSAGLCLQDLVGGGGGGGGGGGSGGSGNNNSGDHLHNHHALHDSVAAAVSVSSAITGLMSVGTGGTGLSHLHHNSHDVSNHHHHSVVPHTPTLHEPLEKLKRKFALNFIIFLY